jgi:hypothetical protein
VKLRVNWKREDRGWPKYLPGGHIRTSTAGLIVAFVLISWIYQTYQPKPVSTEAPSSEVVPPGFVPDPNYTWVPRTNVQTPRSTYRTTTPTTTTTETTTPTTSPGETTSTTGPSSSDSSTPATSTPSGSATPTTMPNRSGTLTPDTTVPPGPGPSPTPPPPAQ